VVHPRPWASTREVPRAEPLLSEIRVMSFNFPPKGWALCNGQLLPINQNQALFSEVARS
jgi:microcystin-dependent protein